MTTVKQSNSYPKTKYASGSAWAGISLAGPFSELPPPLDVSGNPVWALVFNIYAEFAHSYFNFYM